MFDTADFIDFIKSTREELTEKHKANLVNLVDLDEKLKQQIKVSSPFLQEDIAKTERTCLKWLLYITVKLFGTESFLLKTAGD